MRTDLFDFDLPPELIAQTPARPRESARLLHVRSPLTGHRIADLPKLLQPGDLMILNNTRVLPTRFAAMRSETNIAITLVEAIDGANWWAFAKPGRKLRLGDSITLAEGLTAKAVDKAGDGRVQLAFDRHGQDLIDAIKAKGQMPLPPYIRRPKSGDANDHNHYQTVFAQKDGAVAAPTASLHLSQNMLDQLQSRDIKQAFVTLHVGMGTFLPVKSEDTSGHHMHKEWYDIPPSTAKLVNQTKGQGGRIVAIGTTVIRTLESAARNSRVEPASGDTRLFIQPGYDFQIADLLLTNFHLPRSTLFMLVSAFSGLERMQAAYAHAIAQQYRFFSYGDACLLERSTDIS